MYPQKCMYVLDVWNTSWIFLKGFSTFEEYLNRYFQAEIFILDLTGHLLHLERDA